MRARNLHATSRILCKPARRYQAMYEGGVLIPLALCCAAFCLSSILLFNQLGRAFATYRLMRHDAAGTVVPCRSSVSPVFARDDAQTYRLASRIIFSFLSLNPFSRASLLSAHADAAPLAFGPDDGVPAPDCTITSDSEPDSDAEAEAEAETESPPNRPERRYRSMSDSCCLVAVVLFWPVLMVRKPTLGCAGDEGSEGGLTDGGRRAAGGE